MGRAEEIQKGVCAVVASVMTDTEKEILSQSESISNICTGTKADCQDCFMYCFECPELTESPEKFLKIKSEIVLAFNN